MGYQLWEECLTMPGMKTAQLIQHYRNRKTVARQIDVTPTAVTLWGEYPPPAHQLLFELLTGGKLRAERNVWLKLFPGCEHPIIQNGRWRRSLTWEKPRRARVSKPARDEEKGLRSAA